MHGPVENDVVRRVAWPTLMDCSRRVKLVGHTAVVNHSRTCGLQHTIKELYTRESGGKKEEIGIEMLREGLDLEIKLRYFVD